MMRDNRVYNGDRCEWFPYIFFFSFPLDASSYPDETR